MFFGNSRIRFFIISWLDCEQHGKNQYRKKEHNQHGSVFKALRQLSYFVNVTDPLIIPMILIFLSCHEKLMITKNLIMNVQNFIVNQESGEF